MQLCCCRWINDVLALMFNLMLDWTLFSWETVCSETSGLNPQSHVCIYSVIISMYAGAVTDIYLGQVSDVYYGHEPVVTTMYCWLFYASHQIVCGIDSMHMCDKYREGLPASSNLWEEMKSIVLLLPLWYNSGAASSKIRKTKNTLIEDYKTKKTT